MRSIMWEGLVVEDADEIKTRNSNSHIFLTLAMAAQDGLLNLGSGRDWSRLTTRSTQH